MRAHGIDNFKNWREEGKKNGTIKSEYPEFEKNGDLAELIGVVLGDGHICVHDRCESLRVVGNLNSPGFASRYADLIEKVFKKRPTVRNSNQCKAITVTIYQKHISERLNIPSGSRLHYEFQLPEWIRESREYQIRFLRGLYEAEGSLSFHPPTSTHKFIFSNQNMTINNVVLELLRGLGFHPHYSMYKVQVSRKVEVQNLTDLLQFRHYGS